LIQRSIVHTVWWEDTPTGDRAAYTAVVLLDGEYIGWNPVYALSDFVGSTERVIVDPEDTIHLPTLQPGRDQASVVAAFVGTESGHLHAVEIGVLPGDLSLLANRIRARIASYNRIPIGNNLVVLADALKTEIIDLGAGFHPSVRQFLAEQIREKVLDLAPRLNPGQIRRLADEIKSELIDLGATAVRGGGLTHLPNYAAAPTGDSTYAIEEIRETPNTEPTPQSPEHSLAIRAALDLPAPETASQSATIFTSPTGGTALVSWRDAEGRIRYRESQGDGWSEVLALPASLPAEQAEQILRQRILNR
jgi:hypothetical protein